MIFEAWSLSDPLGTKLGDLTEAFDKEIQVDLNGVGSGKFKIRQDSAQSAWVVPDTFIRVRMHPGDPRVFGFFIESGSDAIISRDEEGGEVWERGGRGAEVYLRRAVMYPTEDIGGPAVITEGHWTYTDVAYGAILNNVIANAKARSPDPLPDLTDSISATDDSASVPWPAFDGEMEIPVGMDLFDVVQSLRSQGLYVRVSANLVTSAYVDYTEDLTASVFFEKGVNIRESGNRQVNARANKSRVIVQGSDGEYDEITDASTATVEAGSIGRREGFTQYRYSSSVAVKTRAGQQFLKKSRSQRTGPTTLGVMTDQEEIDPSMRFEPFVDYREGSIVDVHIPGIWSHYAATIHAITVNEDPTGENLVTLSFEDVPFDPFNDMSAKVDELHGPGCKPGCGHAGDGGGGGTGLAPMIPASISVAGPNGDGTGTVDGVDLATWDTGNGSIYHSDAQPKMGVRHEHAVSSACGPGDDGNWGERRMVAGHKYHIGGGGGHTGVQFLEMSYGASHGVGWPNLHPQIGPYHVSYFIYPGTTTNDDAPGDSWKRGIPIGSIPNLGPSTNSVQVSGTFEAYVNLGIPCDDSWNVIFMIVPDAGWHVGGFSCDVSETLAGFCESPSSGGPNNLSDGEIPDGPGMFNGPIAAGAADGVNTIFDVPFGYDYVTEVTLNGIEVMPEQWIATDGSTIETVGWAPLETDQVFVKRMLL